MKKNFYDPLLFLLMLPIFAFLIYLISNYDYFGFGGILILILSAVFFFIVLKNPFLGLSMIVLTLPFERIPTLDIGLFTLKIDQLFAGITIIAWILKLLFDREKMQSYPIGYPIILFLVTGLISTIYAVDLSRAISVYIFIAFMIFVSYLTDNLIDSKEKLINIVKLFFIITFIICLYGIYQFLGDIAGLSYTITGLKDIYTKIVLGFPRIQAFSMEPLFLANYLFIPLGLAVGLYIFGQKQIISEWKLIGLIIFITLIIILGVSRGALIALACMVLFFILLFPKKIINIKNILIFLVSFLVIGASAYGFLKISNSNAIDKFISHVQIQDFETGESVQKRLADYQLAIDFWEESPWIGIGPGNYGPKYKNYPSHDEVSGWEMSNNQYLETLAEFGVIGLIFFVLVFVIIFARTIVAYYKTKDPLLRGLLIGLFSALLAILIQYNFFSTLYIMHIWVLIGIIIATQNLCLNKTTIRN